MTKYQIASHKLITILAIVLEIQMVIVCFLLGDAVLQQYFHVQTLMGTHVSIIVFSIYLVFLQYAIVATEMVARYRNNTKGLTIPLVFIPGGIIVRSVLMCIVELLVITPKLITYFISVLLSFIFQILHIHQFKLFSTAFLVDFNDYALEYFESGVNHIYNLLYYHKINTNSSVFSSIFNNSLSLWCINH